MRLHWPPGRESRGDNSKTISMAKFQMHSSADFLSQEKSALEQNRGYLVHEEFLPPRWSGLQRASHQLAP